MSGPGTRDLGPGNLWRPSASIEELRRRAALFASVRRFFADRGVMEVDTPVLSRYATVDRHIESFVAVPFPGPGPRVPSPEAFLQTSPEFAMKRLLAAGSGPIYQIAPVFRCEESGRLHNPEFRMLEWYRPGLDHHGLMDEVEALCRSLGVTAAEPFERLGYREAFVRHAGFDPMQPAAQLRLELEGRVPLPDADDAQAADPDFWRDLAMSLLVGPALGEHQPCFIHGFPASQAALSRVEDGLAQRFELVWRGVELANGFHELGEAEEQQRRFEADRSWRREHGKPVPPLDEALIAALRHGLPDCAGVALGLDRLLMLLCGETELARVLPFEFARA
ncbi:MAG: EF-P lysine aminoacylase GenX [Gammaproteobacteria bacterium]|nr:EF-P lysine aminoacylase GenX [Gammaproteobacteria bacterium]